MPENLPVERLVRKALRAEETIGRPGIRQLGVPQGAKRLEERLNSLAANIYYESIEFTKKFVKTKHFKKWHRVGGQVK